MADVALNRTRSGDMGEWEITTTDASFSLIGSSTRGRDSTLASVDMEARIAGLCTHLPPPPIPPWLESSPQRLRLLVANCSCWKKYTELCPDNIPSRNLSWMPMGDLHSKASVTDKSMSRLLPFLAAITVGLLMLGVLALAYFWRQRKRRQFSCTAKYLKQTSPSRDYCSPNLYMTPSVTVETQLSLCALEDNFRPYSLYKEESWSYLTDATPGFAPDSSIYESMTSSSHRKDDEVLLKPSQLADSGSQTVYTTPSTSYGDNFYQSHSLPVDSVKGDQSKNNGKKHQPGKRDLKCKDKIKQRHKTRPCVEPTTQETNPPYVQISSSLHDFSDSTYEECYAGVQLPQHETISQPGLNKRKGMVKKCRDARNKMMVRLSRIRSSTNSSTNSPVSKNFPLERPIRALRLSLKGFRTFGQRRLHQSHEVPRKSETSDHAHMSLSTPKNEHS